MKLRVKFDFIDWHVQILVTTPTLLSCGSVFWVTESFPDLPSN